VTTTDGKGTEAPIPDDLEKVVDEYRGQLIEAAAESDDSLLEKYLDAGTLNEEEIQRGLREGILAGKVAPVVCCSATKLLGVRTLMSTIAELLPPAEGDPAKPSKAFVFSTGGDQFGRVSYFKVVAGASTGAATSGWRRSSSRAARSTFPPRRSRPATSERSPSSRTRSPETRLAPRTVVRCRCSTYRRRRTASPSPPRPEATRRRSRAGWRASPRRIRRSTWSGWRRPIS